MESEAAACPFSVSWCVLFLNSGPNGLSVFYLTVAKWVWSRQCEEGAPISSEQHFAVKIVTKTAKERKKRHTG